MPSITKNTKLKWLSLLLIFFYFGYGLYLASQFTWSQGLFFSFCLLAYLGIGLGGLLESPQIVLSSLALALPQALVWTLDAVWFSFFKASVFGTAEGRFTPGMNTLTFILNHYPLFVLPVAIFFLKALPRSHKAPLLLTSLITIVGLFVSRFVFSGVADPNCSKLACIEGFNRLAPSIYPWAFLGFYTIVTLLSAWLMTLYIQQPNPRSPFSRYPRTSLVLFALFSGSVILSDTFKFHNSPKFTCTNQQPVSSVELLCGHTLDYSPGFFYLFFKATNKSPVAKHCNFYMLSRAKKEAIYGAVLIKSNETLGSSVVLPYPTEMPGLEVSLTSECVNLQ